MQEMFFFVMNTLEFDRICATNSCFHLEIEAVNEQHGCSCENTQ